MTMGCFPRDFGYGSVVCVCNKTHCDSIDHIQNTDPKKVQVIESNRQGLRFRTSTIGTKNPLSEPTVRIHINRNQTYQKILGFGAAFTDAAGISATSLGPEMTQLILRNYFSPQGLEYSMGRIVIGGCDFSTRKYTYDDDYEDDMDLLHFNLTIEDDKYKVRFTKVSAEHSSYQIFLITCHPSTQSSIPSIPFHLIPFDPPLDTKTLHFICLTQITS